MYVYPVFGGCPLGLADARGVLAFLSGLLVFGLFIQVLWILEDNFPRPLRSSSVVLIESGFGVRWFRGS